MNSESSFFLSTGLFVLFYLMVVFVCLPEASLRLVATTETQADRMI